MYNCCTSFLHLPQTPLASTPPRGNESRDYNFTTITSLFVCALRLSASAASLARTCANNCGYHRSATSTCDFVRSISVDTDRTVNTLTEIQTFELDNAVFTV